MTRSGWLVIKVVDAIMGSGKSQSCIKYMNDHPDEKFLYVTPYLDEAERIKNGCPALNFVEPSNKIKRFSFSKFLHCKSLIEEGRNIASTHKLISLFNEETISLLKRHKYKLIIDEVLEVFTKSEYSEGDVDLLVKAGHVEKYAGGYRILNNNYKGKKLLDLFTMLKYGRLIKIPGQKEKEHFYYWVFPKEILMAFDEIFVLTYLFESQDMAHYLSINNIPIQRIGINYSDGVYSFSDNNFYVPEYTRKLKDQISILDNIKLNSIGEKYHALSDNWFKTVEADTITRLKRNLYNYFRYYNANVPVTGRMWSTFSNSIKKLSGKGYSNEHVAFNKRATNAFRNKTVLAYCSNVFVRPEKKKYFAQFGIKYDEEGYALSILVQWVWRSAIRDGKPISIYIPSKRMRGLLVGWINSFQEEGEPSDT